MTAGAVAEVLHVPGLSAYVETVAVSAVAWSLAFGLYAVRYATILTRPRVDGKPG